jgi:hypothetical protein
MGWAYSGQHETLHQVCNQIHHQSFYTLPQNLSPSLNQFCPIALTKKGNKLHSKKTCHPNSKYQMSAPQKTQVPSDTAAFAFIHEQNGEVLSQDRPHE